jgi:6-pyruvoyltetrahydropterin/6-carboxytetrahydropterin synthase
LDRPHIDISHSLEFSSAHRLESPQLSAEENRRIYGSCNDRHGHNYLLEVTVRGAVDPATGMVMNLVDLMGIVQEQVFVEVDHKDLNEDVPFLRGVIPTAENIAIACWERIAPEIEGFPGCRLHRIRLHESRANVVEYFGPGAR